MLVVSIMQAEPAGNILRRDIRFLFLALFCHSRPESVIPAKLVPDRDQGTGIQFPSLNIREGKGEL